VYNIKGEGVSRVEVLNSYGQVIMSMAVNAYQAQIDLSNSANGIYLLRVFTEKGMTMKQIIKQ
jgi:hypothetical protein